MRLFSLFQSKAIELFESIIEPESPSLMDDGLSMGLELSASALDLIDDSMNQDDAFAGSDAMQLDSCDSGGCDFGDTDFGFDF
jgi:hypothetical protein